jgi:hypothetical protein
MDQKEEMRKRLLDLNKQRKEMELEIEAIECMLRESGFGLRGNLIDKDGFPIEDTEKCEFLLCSTSLLFSLLLYCSDFCSSAAQSFGRAED